jgi:hypothetical protein
MRLRVPAIASLVDLLLALAPRRAGLVGVAHRNAMPRAWPWSTVPNSPQRRPWRWIVRRTGAGLGVG